MTAAHNLAPHVEEITRALSGRVGADTVREELERFIQHGVPLHQAKRDLVTMLGGMRGGGPVRRKVGAVTVNDQAVDLLAKVITVNAKEITARGEQRTIQYGLLGDETGVLPYTAWRDHGLQAGSVFEVTNAYVTVWQGGPQVNIGDRTQVTPSRETVVPPPAPSRAAVRRTVKELAAGQGSVLVRARVLHVATREIEIQGEPRTIHEGELADDAGRILFTAWHDFGLKDGQAIEIENGYVKTFRGVPSLNFGETANVRTLDDDALPPASALGSDKPFAIEELERAGGALGAEITGVVLEVRPGSGLVFRCPECRRVLQRDECRLHGKVKGEPDLRIKAVIDDGTGALTAFLNRPTTEDLLGRTLEECITMAREAMNTVVIEDELARALVGRRLRVRGNATQDDFGISFIAAGAEPAPPVELAREAQRLLERLQEVGA